jgi:hypothetical protein
LCVSVAKRADDDNDEQELQILGRHVVSALGVGFATRFRFILAG